MLHDQLVSLCLGVNPQSCRHNSYLLLKITIKYLGERGPERGSRVERPPGGHRQQARRHEAGERGSLAGGTPFAFKFQFSSKNRTEVISTQIRSVTMRKT